MRHGVLGIASNASRWAANMKTLKPCPCGEIPESLLVVDNGSKWAYVCGNCCNEWHIEFRTMYHPIESEECMKLAVEAWNLANRGAAEHITALDASPQEAQKDEPSGSRQ